MLDFNRRKKILRKLSDTAEKNVLLLLPCLAAAGLVKLFYFIVCNLDIALSDKDGNFLGIKSREKHSRTRKDDIVYVKKGFMPRVISVVLSFAFVMMFVPTVFPTIQSAAAEMPRDWTSVSLKDSVFVSIDSDTSVVYDISIPFDNFIAPKIEDITDITSTSCKIKWNKADYTRGTGGDALPSKFLFADESSISKCDGIIRTIEVWAFITKDGKTQFKKCDTASSWRGNNVRKDNFTDLAEYIEVINLDPDSEYRFALCANQQWVAYSNTSRNFVVGYELDENNVIKNSDNPTPKKISYPERTIKAGDGAGNFVDAVLYQAGTDVQVYYPGSYGNDNKYTSKASKHDLATASKTATIPHYSNTMDLPARRLADVKTTAVYNHDTDTQLDSVEVRLGSNPPADALGYLVYRSEYAGSDKSYKLIATVDAIASPLSYGDLVFEDTTDSGVKPTTAYKYYIVPVRWETGSGVNSTADYAVKSDLFITGHIPGTGTDSSIDANAASVYTNTAVPQNFSVTQNGVDFVLAWDPVENATGYIIERTFKYGSDPVSGKQTIATITNGTTSTYTDQNIAYDTEYTYYLTAVNSKNPNADGKNSNPPAVVSKKLAMETLYAPHTIQVVPGDDYADISWICSDTKAVGFDIQYIKTDTLKEVTKNIGSKAIAQVKANHPEVTWADIDNDASYINENLSGEYNDTYASLYDEAFTANAKEISQKAADVAVSGQTNKFAYTVHNLTPDINYTFRVRSYVLTADPIRPVQRCKASCERI